VSSLFKSPIISLLVIFSVFFGLWLFWMIGQVTHAEPMMYVYPNFYDAMLVNPRLDRSMTGVACCIAMAALYVGGGSYLFARRDV
jgi:hypothetical protein